MGLLIGASAITIFELLDLIFYNMFAKCAGKKKEEKRIPEKIHLNNQNNQNHAWADANESV